MMATVYHLILAKQSTAANRLWKDVGLTLIILTALLLLSQFTESGAQQKDYRFFTVIMSFIAIIELGNRTFNEFKQERSAYQWLTLPASQTEKWLANFIYSVLVVPVGFLILLSIASVISQLFLTLFGWGRVTFFNPASTEGFILLKSYWYVHPILFFGAVYFKKRPVLKTTSALSLLMFALMLYIVFLSRQLFNNMPFHIELNGANMDDKAAFLMFLGGIADIAYKTGLTFVFHVLAWSYFPFFWGLSYLRLKELEL